MGSYELPRGWEWRTLGGVEGLRPTCEFLDHRRIPVNEVERSRRPGPYPYYGANGQQGWIDDFIFDEELVLLAEDGGFFFDVTKPASYRVSGKCWVNNHAHVLRPAPDVNVDWLNLTLSFADYTPFIPEPVRPKLNQANAKRIPIPIPPLPEQRRIVARIEELTKRLDHTRQVQKQAVAEVQTYLPAAIARVFSEGSLSGWVSKRVKQICEKPQYGYTASASAQPIGSKFVRITDIQDGKVNWDNVPYCRCPEVEKYRLHSEDILFARTGATTGKSYLVENPPEAVFASYLIRLRAKDEILPEFLFWYFQSSSYWAAVFTGIDDGNRPNMNGTKLANVEIPYPSDKGEQRRIVDYLNGLRDKADQLKNLQTDVDTALDSFLPAQLPKAFRAEL